MSEDESAEQTPAPIAPRLPSVVPDGYRQGLITAITVLLGFSLTFVRFWAFDAPGQWALHSVVSTGTAIVAIVLQLIALFRSLRLEDQDPAEYRKTVVWFIASAIAILASLMFAVVEFAAFESE